MHIASLHLHKASWKDFFCCCCLGFSLKYVDYVRAWGMQLQCIFSGLFSLRSMTVPLRPRPWWICLLHWHSDLGWHCLLPFPCSHMKEIWICRRGMVCFSFAFQLEQSRERTKWNSPIGVASNLETVLVCILLKCITLQLSLWRLKIAYLLREVILMLISLWSWIVTFSFS